MGRENLVKNSSIAVKGILNGVIGSTIYSILVSVVVSIVLTAVITSSNPNVGEEVLEGIFNDKYDTLHLNMVITCVSSLIALLVFIFLIKKEEMVSLLKNLFKSKTLKYGVITALCLIGFSIVYNVCITSLFNLDSAGNANQESVTSLIKDSPILGFVAVVLLAPIVEELTYRYCLFGELSKKKKWVAYLVSGVLFMAMHAISSFSKAGGFNKAFLLELIYLPPYLFSGLALCYAYDKSGYLGSSVFAHSFNNLLSFLMVLL